MKRVSFVLLVLLTVMIAAGALRIWGLDYGLPHPLSRPDEERIVGRAQTIFATGDWHPGSFYYPSLLFYVDTGALWAYYGVKKTIGDYDRPFDFLFDVAITRPGLHYLIARWVGAIAGISTVLVTYFLATSAYGRKDVGLVAAATLAACHLHVRESHFATVDVVMTLFITTSLWFAIRSTTRPSWSNFVLAGLGAGLAVSTKYNSGIVALGIVAAGWIAYRSALLDAKTAITRVGAAGAVSAISFAVTSPYVVLRFRGFLADMGGLGGFLYERESALALWQHLGTTLPHGLGWPLYLLAAIATVHAASKRRPADLVLLSFLVPYFALVSGVRITFPRYVVPLVPPLLVLAAELMVHFIHKVDSGRRTLAWIAALVVSITPTLIASVRYDRLASRRDTRLLATDFLAAGAKPQSRILVCKGYGAPNVNTDRRKPPAFVVDEVDCAQPPRAHGAFVVTHEHGQLGGFSRLHPEWTRFLEEHAELVSASSPYRAESDVAPVFYPADAFYIPYAGFAGVERGGPIVRIWRLDPPPD